MVSVLQLAQLSAAEVSRHTGLTVLVGDDSRGVRLVAFRSGTTEQVGRVTLSSADVASAEGRDDTVALLARAFTELLKS